MMRRTIQRLMCALAITFTFAVCHIVLVSTIHADILNITNGTASFRYDSDTPNGGNADLSTTSDILYQETWFVLYQDPQSGTQIVELSNGTAASTGSSGTLTFSGIGAGVLNTGFDVVLSYAVGDDSGAPTLEYSAAVTNTNAIAQNISLFNYFDHDVNGAGGDVATMDTATLDGLTFGDDASGIESFRRFTAVTHYQIATFGSNLDGQLRAGTITALNDTGSPFGPADFTAALQWDLTLASGQTATVFGSVAVPEPGALALLVTGGLVFIGRRRRN